MKITEAIEKLEGSMTDFNLAWSIEKTLAAAKDRIIGSEPVESSSEYEAWETKSEAYEELLELAGGMSDAIGEYEDAYDCFEEEHGKCPQDIKDPKFAEWLESFDEEGAMEEQIDAQSLFDDFKYAFEDFQDEYGDLEDLELIDEEY